MSLSEAAETALRALVNEDFEHARFDDFVSVYHSAVLSQSPADKRASFLKAIQLFLSLTADVYEQVTSADNYCLFYDHVFNYHDAVPGTEKHLRYLALRGVQYFTSICKACSGCPDDVPYALREAADRKMYYFIPNYCFSLVDRPVIAALFVDALWTTDHRHAHFLSSTLTLDIFHRAVVFYIKRTLADRDSWSSLAPLSVWKGNLYYNLPYLLARMSLFEQEAAAVPDFTQSCAEGGAWIVAVLVAAVLGQWPVMRAVIARMPEDVKREYCDPVLDLLCEQKSCHTVILDAMVVLLNGNVCNQLAFNAHRFSRDELRRLASLSKRSRQYKFAAFLYINLQDWQAVDEVIESCQDKQAIDDTVLYAALSANWQVVPTLLARSSNTTDLNLFIFQVAIDDCRADMMDMLLPAIDLNQVDIDAILTRRRLVGDEEQEGEALNDLTTPQMKENFVKIVRLLVQRGASTHCRQGKAALTHALVWRLPYVAHMLITSGAVTRADYSHSLEQGAVKTVLAANPDLKKCLEASAQQAFPQGTRSLLDMCRLAVSHQVGHKPGRQDRIQALPLPAPQKKYVAFDDVLSEGTPL